MATIWLVPRPCPYGPWRGGLRRVFVSEGKIARVRRRARMNDIAGPARHRRRPVCRGYRRILAKPVLAAPGDAGRASQACVGSSSMEDAAAVAGRSRRGSVPLPPYMDCVPRALRAISSIRLVAQTAFRRGQGETDSIVADAQEPARIRSAGIHYIDAAFAVVRKGSIDVRRLVRAIGACWPIKRSGHQLIEPPARRAVFLDQAGAQRTAFGQGPGETDSIVADAQEPAGIGLLESYIDAAFAVVRKGVLDGVGHQFIGHQADGYGPAARHIGFVAMAAQMKSGGRKGGLGQRRAKIRKILAKIDRADFRQCVEMMMHPGDGADASHRLFESVAGFGIGAAPSLQIQQAVDDGEIIVHTVLQFPKEQFAFGQLGVALSNDFSRRHAKGFAHGDDRGRGKRHQDGAGDLLFGVAALRSRPGHHKHPGEQFGSRQGDDAGLPSTQQGRKQCRRIDECEGRRAGRDPLDDQAQGHRHADTQDRAGGLADPAWRDARQKPWNVEIDRPLRQDNPRNGFLCRTKPKSNTRAGQHDATVHSPERESHAVSAPDGAPMLRICAETYVRPLRGWPWTIWPPWSR